MPHDSQETLDVLCGRPRWSFPRLWCKTYAFGLSLGSFSRFWWKTYTGVGGRQAVGRSPTLATGEVKITTQRAVCPIVR